jgi:multicomponent Na+:H+ antiporter subunit D
MVVTAIGAHLPALLVVVPLLAAPTCVLVRHPRRAWALALAVSASAFALAVALLAKVLDSGPVSYAIGGWAAPWGIEYRIDEVNALVGLLVAFSSTVILVFARDSVEREVDIERVDLLYTAWLLCLTGLLGMAVTGDAFNVFVFLEIASLSTYALVALGRERRALLAAFRYLVMGTVGATFILIGVGLLYVLTGTLNMADLAERLVAARDTRTVRAAFGFLTVGVALKMAMFPLHGWLPGAYSTAPTAVAAFLASTATKVAVYLWLRILLTVFGVEFSFDAMGVGRVLMAMALIGIFVASLAACLQDDARMVLGWSSVAQIGYMALGISLVSATGVTAAIVHLVNHALMKAALFMGLGCVLYRIGGTSLASLAGLGRRMPATFAALTLAAMSLVGVPLTVGFVSKWYLLSAALEAGYWPVALMVVLTSLMAVVYVWRILEAAWFLEPAPGSVQARAQEVPMTMLVPLWVLVAANVYLGLDTELTVGVASRAAATLLGGGP